MVAIMTKRDYVGEILSKRSRLFPDNPRWRQVSVNLNKIIESLDLLEPIFERDPFSNMSEILPFFPIRLVACFEGYFRLAYADLIDRVAAFQNNASQFDIKFSLHTAISLRHHSVSLGDFIAHLLPTNNLEDINRNMTKITNEDFLDKFKETRPQIYPLVQTALLPEWEVDPDAEILSRIKRIFELRHIFSHELAPTEVLRIDGIREYSYSAIRFLHVSEEVVTQYLST
jgi:hypothetical protein